MFNSGFTFNGTHSDDHPYVYVNKIHRPLSAPRNANLLKIPGRKGAYLIDVDSDILTLPIDIQIKGATEADYETLLDILNSWLITEDVKELVLDKSSDKKYMAILDGSTDLDETVKRGKGTLTFIIPDGVKYGVEQPQTINDPSGGPANATVTNDGTAETFPKFTINVEQAKTFLSIVSPESSIVLGKPVAVEETQVDEQELVYTTSMDSTTDWVSGNYVDDGVVAGSMSSDGTKFSASSYGTGTGWHGPALVHTLAAPITDFYIGVRLTQKSTSAAQIGRAEMYLLDVNDNIIAKVAMRDGHTGFLLNQGEFKVGDNQVYNGAPGPSGNWNNFDNGFIQVRRKGTAWEFFAGKVADDGSQYAREYVVFYDDNGLYTADVAKVQLHLGQFGTYEVTDQSFGQLNVTKLNSVGANQIPYIVHPGDVLEIDMDKRKILLNGADARYLKDFTSDWFSLKPGQTDLAVYPPDIGKTDITFPPRWL